MYSRRKTSCQTEIESGIYTLCQVLYQLDSLFCGDCTINQENLNYCSVGLYKIRDLNTNQNSWNYMNKSRIASFLFTKNNYIQSKLLSYIFSVYKFKTKTIQTKKKYKKVYVHLVIFFFKFKLEVSQNHL